MGKRVSNAKGQPSKNKGTPNSNHRRRHRRRLTRLAHRINRIAPPPPRVPRRVSWLQRTAATMRRIFRTAPA